MQMMTNLKGITCVQSGSLSLHSDIHCQRSECLPEIATVISLDTILPFKGVYLLTPTN